MKAPYLSAVAYLNAQVIGAYINDLIHFTDDQLDHEPHLHMLTGFLDCQIAMGIITQEHKKNYLQYMAQRFLEKEQQA